VPLLSLRFFILHIGMLAAPTTLTIVETGRITGREARGRDPDGYRAEFVRLAETVRGIGLARKDGAH